MSINKVIISGNLTRDPEIRTTASGTQIMGFSVAVNDRRRDPSTGEWSDYPNYIDCTMFGGQGGGRIDFFQRTLQKGSKVVVEGRLRWSQWEAKDGSGKRSKIEVIVDDIDPMSRSGESGQNQNQGGYQNSGYQGGYQQNAGYGNYGNQGYQNAGYGNYGNAPAPAPQQAAPAAYTNAGYAPMPTMASPAITPAIDATSAVYDEDIPF